MQSVILAGGMGTRLREETEYRPKPMIEVGGRPILWHIMKNLAQQGMQSFVVCLGYKGDQIRDFFINYESRINDITIKLGRQGTSIIHGSSFEEDWEITLANTGLETMTGGRLHAVKKYLQNERFLCTYGDGLADIDISALLDFHKSHGKIATVTTVIPTTRFGAIQIDGSNKVTEFSEKPRADKWVNGGFFIFEPGIFNYLNKSSVLEREPLERLTQDGELMAYKHNGFWQPMDTFRETQELNSLWNIGSAPWRNW